MKFAFFALGIVFLLGGLFAYSGNVTQKVVRPTLPENMDGIVTNIWLHEEERLDRLRENHIKMLTVDIGGISQNGEILTPKEDIMAFIKFIEDYEKKKDYDFLILPYSEINTYKYNFNSVFIKNLAKSYGDLADMGFDGAYIDVEPVPKKLRSNYLLLLKQVRSELSKNKTLAVYSGAVGYSDNEWEWNMVFFKQVSQYAEIIVIPVYDSYINSEKEYEDYVRMQISQVSIIHWPTSSFMLGIPSHKVPPETIGSSYKIYLNQSEKFQKSPFIGVNIFSEWTTSDEEWKNFEELNPKLKIIYLNDNKLPKK